MRSTFLAAVIIILVTGCATSPKVERPPGNDPHVKPTKIKVKNCKLPQTIYIDATRNDTVFFPHSIELCKKETDLIWLAFGAQSLEIRYKPAQVDPNEQAEVLDAIAPCEKAMDADGNEVGVSCVLSKGSHKSEGYIDYSVKMVTKNGTAADPVDIDPQLIIRR